VSAYVYPRCEVPSYLKPDIGSVTEKRCGKPAFLITDTGRLVCDACAVALGISHTLHPASPPPPTCGTCAGTQQVPVIAMGENGPFDATAHCPTCHPTSVTCAACNGTGGISWQQPGDPATTYSKPCPNGCPVPRASVTRP